MTLKNLSFRLIIRIFTITILLLILSNCDIINLIIESGDEDDDTTINSTTIDTDGGVINADGLTFTIPAGAFSQAVNIDIYLSSVTDDSIDNIATKVYKIDGIPDEYSKPIDVSIKHNGNISEQSYLIVQEESYIPSLNSINANNIFFDATVIGDSIKSQIPAMTASLAKVASIDDIRDDSVWKIYAVDKKKNHTTSGNHFNIIYTSSVYASHNDEETDVIALGQYLEDAYTKISGLGFSYARRTKWPIDVYIADLADNIDGYHCPSRWGLNSSFLEINRKHLSKQTPMKTTSIHEFFHFVQYLYDDRFFITRATFTAPHHWFNEACAVWSEELVTNSQYISEAKGPDTVKFPFNGLQAGSEVNASDHGYGMSAFVKYIVKKYSQNVLVNIYDKLYAGKHVVDAINQNTNDMLFIDYNLFLQQYAHGQLYPDVGLPVFAEVDNLDGTFEIKSDTDKLKTFSEKYRELSGKIYLVKLDNPNFKDDTSLEISIDQELCHITVFKYPEPPNPFNVLAEGGKSCTVSDLKGLKAQNKNLIVIVTNGNLIKIPEYTKSSKDINVKMEIGNDYNGSLRFKLDNVVTDKSSSRAIEEALSFGGYNGSYYYENLGRTYSGTVGITFIDNSESINFHLNGQYTYQSLFGFGEVTFKYTVDYNGIPYTGLEGVNHVYSVTGSAVQNGYFTWSETNWGGTNDESIDNLISYNCGADAYIRVEVNKRE